MTFLNVMVSSVGEGFLLLTWMFAGGGWKDLPGLDSSVLEGQRVASAALLGGAAAGRSGQRLALLL